MNLEHAIMKYLSVIDQCEGSKLLRATVDTTHTSAMIYHCGASLSEQHTDLLICHCTEQDLPRTSRCVDKSSPEIASYHIRMPTARAATLSVVTYA